MAQQKRIRLGTMKLRVRSLASLRGLRIRRCCELWCVADMAWIWCGCGCGVGWQLQLQFDPLAWERSHAAGVALNVKKKKKKKNQKTKTKTHQPPEEQSPLL